MQFGVATFMQNGELSIKLLIILPSKDSINHKVVGGNSKKLH